jgi:hypothetical protein
MPHAGMDEPSIVRIELHAEGDRTRMVLTDGPYRADGGRHAATGWNAAVDKLDLRLRDR